MAKDFFQKIKEEEAKEDSVIAEVRRKKKAGTIRGKDLDAAVAFLAKSKDRFKMLYKSPEEKELRELVEERYFSPIGR